MNPKLKGSKPPRAQKSPPQEPPAELLNKTKFEGYGEEMLEKTVKPSGNSGRVYLPPEWVGKTVKIIRLN